MDAPTKDELWAEKKETISRFMADPRTMGGRDRLWNHIREQHPEISRRDVARALKEDPVTQQHQPLNKRVTTRPIIVSDKAKVVQIDLVDMQKLAGKNEGYRYFLTYVDLLSKYSAARPIKNKTQANVTASLIDILDGMPEEWRPKTIQADNGSEFQVGMQRALQAKGIKLIHSQPYNPRSQGAVERLNKSIKMALFNLMARHESYRWIDFLEPLIENLNSSKHESTGYKPQELMEKPLEKETIDEIHERMERRRPKHPEKLHHVYALGDFVRVALVTESAIRKQTFRKKIMNNWSKEVFQIYSISEPEAAGTQPQYLLKNLTTNRKSRKKYWSYQLLQVTKPDDNDAVEEASEPEEERYLPVEPQQPQPPGPPRRSARAWAPSQEGLRHFAARA